MMTVSCVTRARGEYFLHFHIVLRASFRTYGPALLGRTDRQTDGRIGSLRNMPTLEGRISNISHGVYAIHINITYAKKMWQKYLKTFHGMAPLYETLQSTTFTFHSPGVTSCALWSFIRDFLVTIGLTKRDSAVFKSKLNIARIRRYLVRAHRSNPTMAKQSQVSTQQLFWISQSINQSV